MRARFTNPILLSALAVASPAWAEDAAPAAPSRPYAATVTLNQDPFFGFYPTFAGSHAINDGVDLTFYSILWTVPAFGTPDTWVGSGLWTEVGAGASFDVLDGALAITPQLGVLNGNLLNASGKAKAFEGIVPNLTIDHDGTWTQAQLYAGYYAGARQNRANNYLHYWVNGGIKPFARAGGLSALSAGVHFEHLRALPTDGDAYDYYMWFGPYLQIALPNRVALRFSAGIDLTGADHFDADFYKISISFGL